MGVWGLRPQRVQGGARWGVQGGVVRRHAFA